MNQGSIYERKIESSYNDTIEYLKTRFQYHMNLYQKQILESKVKCYLGPDGNVNHYYGCIDDVEFEKEKNSKLLQKAFAKIEYETNECKQNCKSSFPDKEENQFQCSQKCIEKMGNSCENAYNGFYEKVIGQNPEYKKLK